MFWQRKANVLRSSSTSLKLSACYLSLLQYFCSKFWLFYSTSSVVRDFAGLLRWIGGHPLWKYDAKKIWSLQFLLQEFLLLSVLSLSVEAKDPLSTRSTSAWYNTCSQPPIPYVQHRGRSPCRRSSCCSNWGWHSSWHRISAWAATACSAGRGTKPRPQRHGWLGTKRSISHPPSARSRSRWRTPPHPKTTTPWGWQTSGFVQTETSAQKGVKLISYSLQYSLHKFEQIKDMEHFQLEYT